MRREHVCFFVECITKKIDMTEKIMKSEDKRRITITLRIIAEDSRLMHVEE